MSHDPIARQEAAVSRWSPAAPAPELLERARPAQARHHWVPVQGPHLRPIRRTFARNKTGVVGISFGHVMKNGRRQRVLVVNLGSTNRRVYIESIGPAAAWRRALEIRAAHERRVAAANALILAARERSAA